MIKVNTDSYNSQWRQVRASNLRKKSILSMINCSMQILSSLHTDSVWRMHGSPLFKGRARHIVLSMASFQRERVLCIFFCDQSTMLPDKIAKAFYQEKETFFTSTQKRDIPSQKIDYWEKRVPISR